MIEDTEHEDYGSLVFSDKKNKHDPHDMILLQARNSDSSKLAYDVQTALKKELHHEFEFFLKFPDETSKYDLPWIVFFQVRGNGYTGPQVGLYYLNPYKVLAIRQYDPRASRSGKYRFTHTNIRPEQGMELKVNFQVRMSRTNPYTKIVLETKDDDSKDGWDVDNSEKFVYENRMPNYTGASRLDVTLGLYSGRTAPKEGKIVCPYVRQRLITPIKREIIANNTDGYPLYTYSLEHTGNVYQSGSSGDNLTIKNNQLCIHNGITDRWIIKDLETAESVFSHSRVQGNVSLDRWAWGPGDHPILTTKDSELTCEDWDKTIELPPTVKHKDNYVKVYWRFTRASGENQQYAIARGKLNNKEHDFILPFTATNGSLINEGRWLLEMTDGLDRIAHNYWVWSDRGLYFSPGGTSEGSATNSRKTYYVDWDGGKPTQIEDSDKEWTHQTQFGDQLMYSIYAQGVILSSWENGPTGSKKVERFITPTQLLKLFEQAGGAPGLRANQVGYVHGHLIKDYAIFTAKTFNYPRPKEILVAWNTKNGAHKLITNRVPLYDPRNFNSAALPSMSVHEGKGVAAYQGLDKGRLKVFSTTFDLPE